MPIIRVQFHRARSRNGNAVVKPSRVLRLCGYGAAPLQTGTVGAGGICLGRLLQVLLGRVHLQMQDGDDVPDNPALKHDVAQIDGCSRPSPRQE